MDKRRPENQLVPSLKKKVKDESALIQTMNIHRTSKLHAPIMLLTGHEAEVLTCKFSKCGNYLASGSFDKTILLWHVYGQCVNHQVIRGHNGAILDLEWSKDSEQIYTASSDKTVGIFDSITGSKILKLKGKISLLNHMIFTGHKSYLNSINVGRSFPFLIATGGDEGAIKIWDQRQKEAVHSFNQRFPITSVSFNETGDSVFAGSLDNEVTTWDLRASTISYKLSGHTDTITSLRLSPDGHSLLSNSMDNTVRIWDIKPYASGNRCLKIFEGAPHGFEKNLIKASWSADGSRIACGSGDRTVVVWDTVTRRILYKLPGHKGCVNEVDFHPKEPIGKVSLCVNNSVVVSCGNDRLIFLGELEP